MNRNIKLLFFSQSSVLLSLFLFFFYATVNAQETFSFDALTEGDTRSASRTSAAAGAGIHIVKPSETLYGISRKYSMTVPELRRLNDLRSNLIKPGQRLKVIAQGQSPRSVDQETQGVRALQRGVANGASGSLNNFAPRDQVDMELDILASPRATYPPPINATARTTNVKPLVPTSTLARTGKLNVEKKRYHQVKRGDDLYSIADTYEVSVNELKGWNMLERVTPGQVIIVQKWYEEIDREEAEKIDNSRSVSANATSTRAISSPSQAAGLRVTRAEKLQAKASNASNSGENNSFAIPVGGIFKPGSWMEGTKADSGPFMQYENKSIQDLRFYAVHPWLPIGSTVKMQLPDNPGYIELIIVDRFNNEGTNAIIGISPASAKILKDAGSRTVTIRY